MGSPNNTISLNIEDVIRNKSLKERHLNDIIEVSVIINSRLDLNYVLKQIIYHATRLTNSVAASIILLSEFADNLVVHYATGPVSNSITSFMFPSTKGIAGLCIRTGQVKIVHDVEGNTCFFGEIDEFTGFKTKSILCVPLTVKGNVIGCIELINKLDNKTFNNEDIAIATLMSNFAAMSIRNAKAFENLKNTNLALQSQIPSFNIVTSKNKNVRKIDESISKLKDINSTVLILGESGTGKGVLARSIHEQSNRKGQPFVTINCSVFSKTLLESELFGHEKGAFTGADRLKKGRFEIANRGTVFLDEIGEIDRSIQTKLLRILQEKEFERVGGTETLTTDTRIIAATNINLERALEENSFRKDLYYRLKVIVFQLPPLRERREDIPCFAKYFLEKYCKEMNKSVHIFDDESMNVLLRYDYPGNIRELENIIERAVVLAEEDVLHINDLPEEIQNRQNRYSSQANYLEKSSSVYEMEKESLCKTLFECSWNQSKASRLLGISRDMLRYRLKKYKISKPNNT